MTRCDGPDCLRVLETLTLLWGMVGLLLGGRMGSVLCTMMRMLSVMMGMLLVTSYSMLGAMSMSSMLSVMMSMLLVTSYSMLGVMSISGMMGMIACSMVRCMMGTSMVLM